jgi:hypothetical protein
MPGYYRCLLLTGPHESAVFKLANGRLIGQIALLTV